MSVRLKPGLVSVLLPAVLFGLARAPHRGGQREPQTTRHTVTLADLTSVKGEGLSLSVSPDGRTLAYSSDGFVWLVSIEPGSTPRQIVEGRLPVWSPAGDRVAYYSDQSGVAQLWTYDVKTGEADEITNLAGGIDPDPFTRVISSFPETFRISWSPDGDRIVFASRARRKTASPSEREGSGARPWAIQTKNGPLVLTPFTPASWTLAGVLANGYGRGSWRNGEAVNDTGTQEPDEEANELFIADVRTKALWQLTTDGGVYFHPDWSPDGTKIVCVSGEGKSPMATASSGTNLYLIDAATGGKTRLTRDARDKSMPHWSPNGRWIGYRAGAHFGISHIYVTSPDGTRTKVLPPLDRYSGEWQWMPDSKSVALVYRDGVTVEIARVDLENGVAKILSGPEPADRSGLSVSSSGVVAWREDGPSMIGAIRVLRPGEAAAGVAVDLNPQTRTWELGEQVVVRWKNRRGEDLEGLLIKPVGYHEGRRYPVIVDTYPMQRNDIKGPMSGNQALAARGYAIFWPNARAPHVWMNGFKSEGYSQAAKGPGGWDVTTDDVMSGVDELIRSGIADPDRMCLYGFSNGGAIVDELITRTNRFRCAISVAGAISDWLLGALLKTDSKIQDFEGGDDPWTDPMPYLELSAVFRLERVHTPVLLADGDGDDEYLLNTIEMYNGLRHLGKDVTFLRYSGEEHGFTGAALEDFWKRENAFFDSYLKK